MPLEVCVPKRVSDPGDPATDRFGEANWFSHFCGVRCGGVLVLMGGLIWAGELFQLNIEAQRFLDRVGLNFFNQV